MDAQEPEDPWQRYTLLNRLKDFALMIAVSPFFWQFGYSCDEFIHAFDIGPLRISIRWPVGGY